MKTAADYLDALRAQLGIRSDNGLAPILGVTRGAISRYRLGITAFDEPVAERAAQALNIPVAVVVLDMAATSSRNPTVRAVWERIARDYAGMDQRQAAR